MCNRPANNGKVFRPRSLRMRGVELSMKFLECTPDLISAVLRVLPARRAPAESCPIFFAGVLIPDLSRIDGPRQKVLTRWARVLQPFMNLLAEFGNIRFVQAVFKSIEDPACAQVI